MKIYVSAPNENWILDRIASEWRENRPSFNTNNIHEADVVWFLDSYSWRKFHPVVLNTKKIVASVHHVVPWKFNLQEFMMRDQIVDCYHVPCLQTKNFIKKLTQKPISVVGYWYNPQLWFPADKTQARAKLKITEEKYVVGSFQRDTEGHDLKTPKFEKGPDLFCEYVKGINKDVHVLLGGWRRQYVIGRLEEAKIPYTYKEMAPIDSIREMYAACDLYVVSSRHEGGPQALLEASAMKVPIVSTNVGMAPQILSERCILEHDNKKIYTTHFPTKEDINKCYENVLKYNVETHIEKYVQMFNKVNEKK